MQPPQSIEEIKAGLETTEKGGVQPRLDFLNALGRLHGVHGVF